MERVYRGAGARLYQKSFAQNLLDFERFLFCLIVVIVKLGDLSIPTHRPLKKFRLAAKWAKNSKECYDFTLCIGEYFELFRRKSYVKGWRVGIDIDF